MSPHFDWKRIEYVLIQGTSINKKASVELLVYARQINDSTINFARSIFVIHRQCWFRKSGAKLCRILHCININKFRPYDIKIFCFSVQTHSSVIMYTSFRLHKSLFKILQDFLKPHYSSSRLGFGCNVRDRISVPGCIFCSKLNFPLQYWNFSVFWKCYWEAMLTFEGGGGVPYSPLFLPNLPMLSNWTYLYILYHFLTWDSLNLWQTYLKHLRAIPDLLRIL